MKKPKIEAYDDKKIAAKDDLILDGEAVDTLAFTKPELVEQGMVEEGVLTRLEWQDDPECVIIHDQPAIGVYISMTDGIVIAQKDGACDQTVYFRPEHAETVSSAILALAKWMKSRVQK
jgi:hypothetical protein